MLRHLTDDEIQLYVIGKESCDLVLVEHVHSCQLCKAKAETYELLITGIKQQPAPAFDFNLSELVLLQLPAPKPKAANEKLISWIFILLGLVVVTATSIYLSEYLAALFKGFSAAILVYLVIVTATTVIGVLVVDLYKKYNKEMKFLDMV